MMKYPIRHHRDLVDAYMAIAAACGHLAKILECFPKNPNRGQEHLREIYACASCIVEMADSLLRFRGYMPAETLKPIATVRRRAFGIQEQLTSKLMRRVHRGSYVAQAFSPDTSRPIRRMVMRQRFSRSLERAMLWVELAKSDDAGAIAPLRVEVEAAADAAAICQIHSDAFDSTSSTKPLLLHEAVAQKNNSEIGAGANAAAPASEWLTSREVQAKYVVSPDAVKKAGQRGKVKTQRADDARQNSRNLYHSGDAERTWGDKHR